MKKLLALFIFYFIVLNLVAQDFDFAIGKLGKTGPVLTIDRNAACAALSKNLLVASNIKETYTTVELMKVNDNYALVFSGAKYKTTFAVKVIDNNLLAKVKVSCTTTGPTCALDGYACVPTSDVGSCACTACPNNETCTKTCSSDSLIQ